MTSTGLCGCHRTGKTTLARRFAERHEDYVFLQTDVSQVFNDMGLNPAIHYGFDVRLDIQERILSVHREQYASMNGRSFITDRTPIDFMAYTVAEVGPNSLTPELTKRLDAYLAECIKVTNMYFPLLVIVQPGIAIEEAAGKGSLNPAYMEHIAALVMGLTASEAIQSAHFFIPRRTLDIEKRVDAVEKAIGKTVDRHQSYLTSRTEAGFPVVFH